MSSQESNRFLATRLTKWRGLNSPLPNTDNGNYTIVFTTPFTSAPNCFFRMVNGTDVVNEVITLSANGQQVSILTGFVIEQSTATNVGIEPGAAGFEFVCNQ